MGGEAQHARICTGRTDSADSGGETERAESRLCTSAITMHAYMSACISCLEHAHKVQAGAGGITRGVGVLLARDWSRCREAGVLELVLGRGAVVV